MSDSLTDNGLIDNGLTDRYSILKDKSVDMVSMLNNKRKDLQSKKDKIADFLNSIEIKTKDIETLTQSYDIFKQVIEEISTSHIRRISDLVTYALQVVFDDREYKFFIEIEDKRKVRTLEFYLEETIGDEVIRTKLEQAVGGGILAVVGFIMQVIFIEYFNLSRVMFMDEPFSQVSARYISNVISLIKELSRQKGFKFILISHDDRINKFADVVYRVDNGRVGLL